MPLAMQKFFSFQPHLPFRFKVEFFFSENDLKIGENFTYFVKSVKLPVIEPGEGEGTIFLGNGILSIPIFNPASREISITFEENDYMDILRLIDILNYIGFRTNGFSHIIIGITEYETDMNTPFRRKAYCVRFKGYDEPQFSNAGGVNLVTTSMTFKVDSEIGNWDGEEIKVTGNAKKMEELTTEVSGVELKDLVSATFGKNSVFNKLTDEQRKKIAELFNKANEYGLLNKPLDSSTNWITRFETQFLNVDVDEALANAEKTLDNVNKLNEKLSKKGYSLELAGVNDNFGAIFGEHTGDKSQHYGGKKVDLKIKKDGKSIDISSSEGKKALETLEEVNKDLKLINTAVGEKPGDGTGWIDVNFTGSDWNKGKMKGIITDKYVGKNGFTSYK